MPENVIVDISNGFNEKPIYAVERYFLPLSFQNRFIFIVVKYAPYYEAHCPAALNKFTHALHSV
ncbi:hypothetical protein NOR53_2506 [gamma proteobacterium NOR5-3]|nr:hypothetical protein NOR53_2506 [gamma proteobacterium NOR5-3]